MMQSKHSKYISKLQPTEVYRWICSEIVGSFQLCNTNPFKYKCPTCFIKYCSLPCFTDHRQTPCQKPQLVAAVEKVSSLPPMKYKFPSADTVPVEKLEELVNNADLKECLSNPHLRTMLTSLVKSDTPDQAIKDAMQEPIFIELAHACLQVVEPQKVQPQEESDRK
uniref:EOG090X0JQ4 n=1 Tax=Eubosmina coregoni TaxID=186181 RepID=A0A4Y7LSA0_9CRUS|nr:EOG090X0JQ4 [Eubosmina coregoni]SVE70193.1 EOG090X0JQ4 [Eubosmina coregoni]